jgi:hypothetical protein
MVILYCIHNMFLQYKAIYKDIEWRQLVKFQN